MWRAPRPRRPRPGWLVVALGAAVGFLVGVVFMFAIGGADHTATVTRTVVRPAPARHQTGAAAAGNRTVIVRTPVPALVGERLDVAKQRLQRAGFLADVNGGGLFGVVVDSHWQITEQDPIGGQLLERGSTVHLDVDRRSGPF
jgi:hypothetical protein